MELRSREGRGRGARSANPRWGGERHCEGAGESAGAGRRGAGGVTAQANQLRGGEALRRRRAIDEVDRRVQTD